MFAALPFILNCLVLEHVPLMIQTHVARTRTRAPTTEGQGLLAENKTYGTASAKGSPTRASPMAGQSPMGGKPKAAYPPPLEWNDEAEFTIDD
jgi:hypothetical protein